MKKDHYLDTAKHYQSVMDTYDLTQQDFALRIGVTQSTVANALRLLTLPLLLRQMLRRSSLTSRHARALLSLPTEEMQMEAFLFACKEKISINDFEKHVEEMLMVPDKKGRRRAIKFFAGIVDWSVKMLNDKKVEAKAFRRETGDHTEIIIRIPKK